MNEVSYGNANAVPVQVPAVQNELTMLEGINKDLLKCLEELEMRLAVVLKDIPPQIEMDAVKAAENPSSPIVGSLRSRRTDINIAISKISSILRRLDI